MHFNVFDELEAKPARLNDDDLESFPSESLPASRCRPYFPILGPSTCFLVDDGPGESPTRTGGMIDYGVRAGSIFIFFRACACALQPVRMCVCACSPSRHTREAHLSIPCLSSLHILLLGYMAGSLAQNHHPSAHPRPGGRRRKGGSRRRGCRRSPRDRPGGVIRPLCPSVCPRCAAPASLPASPPPLPPRENTHLFKKPSLMLQRRFCSVARQGWRLLLRVWHI
jgi:hypothetical protein